MSMLSAAGTAQPHPHYRYDPQEALEQFRARQAQAFAAGRRAWRERLIKAHLLPFYEALVAYVGQNQYAWVKEQTLAAEFSVHVATIKRWLAALEAAGLIRRQRRFATSSLTYLTAYDVVEQDAPLLPASITSPAPRAVQALAPTVHRGSTDAPTLSAQMRCDSIKDEPLSSVGGTQVHNQVAVSPEVQQILAREGVGNYALAPMIQQKPFTELQAISSYLSRQRHIHDRPRLFAWLASRDFGAQLLHGRHERAERKVPLDAASVRRTPRHEATATPSSALSAPTTAVAGGSAHQQLWHAVLTTVQQEVPPEAFETWLADTVLLEVNHQQQHVVIGTPNVFARDVVQHQYCAVLLPALAARLPQPYALQVVVERS